MGIVPIIFILLGGLILVVSAIMRLIAAYRASIWWLLAILLIPLASLVFLITHWPEAKRSFFLGLIGFAMVVGGLLSSPEVRGQVSNGLSAAPPAVEEGKPVASATGTGTIFQKFWAAIQAGRAKPAAAPSLAGQIQDRRAGLEKLEAQFAADGAALVQRFQQLTARRDALKPNDQEGLAAFNAEVAAYQAQNELRRAASQELAALRQEIEHLVDLRSHEAVMAKSGKKVIVYSIQSCGACQVAKSYFAQKNVPYEERDVNASPQAREQYEKLGGGGLPLIVVGNQKMQGFNAAHFDSLYLAASQGAAGKRVE